MNLQWPTQCKAIYENLCIFKRTHCAFQLVRHLLLTFELQKWRYDSQKLHDVMTHHKIHCLFNSMWNYHQRKHHRSSYWPFIRVIYRCRFWNLCQCNSPCIIWTHQNHADMLLDVCICNENLSVSPSNMYLIYANFGNYSTLTSGK